MFTNGLLVVNNNLNVAQFINDLGCFLKHVMVDDSVEPWL